MKNTIFFFMLLFCIHFVNAIQTDTVNIRIFPSSDDYTTLKKAMENNTDSPLKITLSKGIYYMPQSISTSRNQIEIYFEKGAKMVFNNSNDSGFVVLNDNFILDGAYLQGSGQPAKDLYSGFGILLKGVSNCTIKNSVFDKISGIGILVYPKNETIGSSFNKIIKNQFINPVFDMGGKSDESAILIGYSGKGYMHSNNEVRNNKVDCGYKLKIGIGLIGHGANNIFANNDVSNCRSYGILVYESIYNDTSLYGNKVWNNIVKNIGEINDQKTVKGMGIYFMKSYNSEVVGNKVYNTMNNSDETESLGPGAISLSLSQNSLIKDNFIDGSYMYGIVTDYSFGTKILNNTVQNIRKSGAYFINENDIVVSENIFRNIGQVVLKGYFENTSLPFILDQLVTNEYKYKQTGWNFMITGNKFYTDKDILYFTGTTAEQVKGNIVNEIGNNTFENNTIFNNIKPIKDLVVFKQEKTGTNKIQNNK